MLHEANILFFGPSVNLKLLKVFYADDSEHEIMSTLFHVHEDLDACLIRVATDISDTIDQIPCITKVSFSYIKALNIRSILRDYMKISYLAYHMVCSIYYMHILSACIFCMIMQHMISS